MFENEEPRFKITTAGDRTPEDREPEPESGTFQPDEREYWKDDRPLTRESPGGMYGDEMGGQKSEDRRD